MSLTIEGRRIGRDNPTFVIAEIGVNHDGSLARALQLVDHAAEAGADAIKLQIFRASTLMHASADFAGYQKEHCTDSDPAAMLRRYELTPLDIVRIVEHIRHRCLVPLATPFSPSDVDLIELLDLPAVKIASPDLVNLPLLQRCAEVRKPLVLSTGAASLDEIDATVSWLRSWDMPFALLQCVSSYPTPPEHAHIRWVAELAARYDVPVGFSDHTQDGLSGALAVAAGACIIEKHITHDCDAPGPDHALSASPAQFARYIATIRLAERLCGRPGKRVLDIEQDVRRISRQSLVLARDLPAGHILTGEDLTVKRPGTGIPAASLPRVIGRRLARDLHAGAMLTWNRLVMTSAA